MAANRHVDLQAFRRVDQGEPAGKKLRLNMADNGRVLIPAEMRAALGMPSGGPLLARVDEDRRLVLEPLDNVVRRAQERMRAFVKPGESLADELITDRRRAADRE